MASFSVKELKQKAIISSQHSFVNPQLCKNTLLGPSLLSFRSSTLATVAKRSPVLMLAPYRRARVLSLPLFTSCLELTFSETHIPYMTGMRDCAAELGGIFLEILEG